MLGRRRAFQWIWTILIILNIINLMFDNSKRRYSLLLIMALGINLMCAIYAGITMRPLFMEGTIWFMNIVSREAPYIDPPFNRY